MSVNKFEWDNAEWATIENRYGKLLSYNHPRYNRSYSTCGYQGYITKMLESDKYNTFIDVGAYIGLFSQIASFHCQRVIAYEAHPFYFGILLFNMRRRHVECKYRFVTDYNILGDFQIPKMNDDVKGLIVSNEGTPYNIKCTTLDDEYNPRNSSKLTLIKLDIEGNELKALEGSYRLLSKDYIHWIIDVHINRGITPESVLEYFPNRKITMISPKVIKVEGLE